MVAWFLRRKRPMSLVTPFLFSLGFVLVPLMPGVVAGRRLGAPRLRRATSLVLLLTAAIGLLLVLAICPPTAQPLLLLGTTTHVILLATLVALVLAGAAVDAFEPDSSSLAMWIGPVLGFVAVLPLMLQGIEMTEPIGAGLVGLGLGFGLGALSRAGAARLLRRWTGGRAAPFEGL